MKYALKYFSTSKKLFIADEIIIKYNKYSPALLDFVKDHINQRVIAIYKYTGNEEKSNVELFIEAKKINPNFTVMLTIDSSDYMLDLLRENDINFFFEEYATSLEELNFFIKQNSTDIYIAQDLCFNLKEVSEYCHKNNVSIRVNPNVAESNLYNYSNGIKDFFIRPDDLDSYEKYIDVIEFWGPLDKQDVLYDIYRDGRWQGLLSDLILGFNEKEEVNCMNLMPDFGHYRTNCKHRCMIDKCNYCDISLSLAEVLAEKDIYITREKKKYEYNANKEPMRNEFPESCDIPVEVSE